MQTLRTVLLKHARRADTHLDWMFETPGPDARTAALTTYRLSAPWWHWPALGRLPLTPLPPHRRAYLTRQGALTGDRGTVTRVASGSLVLLGWHAAGGTLVLRPDDPGTPTMCLTLRATPGVAASVQIVTGPLGSAAAAR